jgi:preprotein translocase subunit SecA
VITSSPLTAALKFLRPYAVRPANHDHALVARIRQQAEGLRSVTDRQLAERTAELRRRVQAGEAVTSPSVLVPTHALVYEAARRVLGIELYPVQLLGGLALSRGSIAEMQTGEGKTFAAMLPASLLALAGGGVHVATVNAYLARRDYELLRPTYQLLGFSVGLVDAETDSPAKRVAYAADITYGPGYEFGFDYLRDQVTLLSRHKHQLGESFRARLRGRCGDGVEPVQRGHAVAIIDEADSVLIDEATTPLILASGGDRPAVNADVYHAAARVAESLEAGQHFVNDKAADALHLTQAGIERIASPDATIPRRGLDRPWRVYVEQALRAECLFRRDVHYVVLDDQIQLVDQYTGRIFTDRSWRDGLQQAVQAKEGVRITTETESIARITRQTFFRMYKALAGMTGTTRGAERELRDVYGLNVVVIPPNRPCRRTVMPARAFADSASKEQAILAEIQRLHAARQPILVGTADIDASPRLARCLDHRQLSCQLLNGKQDAEEAAIVAQAGQVGTVTIATNMAGRGTDIKLGPGAVDLGGLHVIAVEPQESQRVDRQLMGRAARQGDPGSSQLFASADDTLFCRHAPALAEQIRRLAAPHGEVRKDLSREIQRTQQRVERDNARKRREMFARDRWIEDVLAHLNGRI